MGSEVLAVHNGTNFLVVRALEQCFQCILEQSLNNMTDRNVFFSFGAAGIYMSPQKTKISFYNSPHLFNLT